MNPSTRKLVIALFLLAMTFVYWFFLDIAASNGYWEIRYDMTAEPVIKPVLFSVWLMFLSYQVIKLIKED